MMTITITLGPTFANALAARARTAKQSPAEHAESIVTTALVNPRAAVPLTPRQAEAFGFIAGYIEARGYAPSFSEIGEAVRLKSNSGVHRLLAGMVERGAVRYVPAKARSLTIVERSA